MLHQEAEFHAIDAHIDAAEEDNLDVFKDTTEGIIALAATAIRTQYKAEFPDCAIDHGIWESKTVGAMKLGPAPRGNNNGGGGG